MNSRSGDTAQTTLARVREPRRNQMVAAEQSGPTIAPRRRWLHDIDGLGARHSMRGRWSGANGSMHGELSALVAVGLKSPSPRPPRARLHPGRILDKLS